MSATNATNAPLGSSCHASHCCASQTSYLCGKSERFCSFEVDVEHSSTKLIFTQDTFRKRFRSQTLWESNPTSVPWHPSLIGHDSHAIQLHQLGRELLLR